MTHRILLVDDEQDILEFISYNLIKEGYDVSTASNGKEAVIKAIEFKPHLILLDVMMPEMDGFETCKVMRTQPCLHNTVIAFLSARNEDHSQIMGFDSGADDYIPKPIRVNVLVSRIKAILKRLESTVAKAEVVSDSNIIIDRERYIVINNGVELTLPRKEFELLCLLHSRPNKVFSREEIFANVWGNNVIVGDRTIDVHIRKLREKLGDHHIVTTKGVGYKFED